LFSPSAIGCYGFIVPNTRRPSIADVAALAGVSQPTVSRVLNGKGRAATRDKVLDAAAKAGYRHKLVTRELPGTSANEPESSSTFSTVYTIEKVARRAGCATSIVSLLDSDPEVAESFLRFLLDRGVDAIIVVPEAAGLQNQIDEFNRIHHNEWPHQALPGRTIPQADLEAAMAVEPPETTKVPPVSTSRAVSPYQAKRTISGTRRTRVRNDGTIRVQKTEFRIGNRYAGQTFYVKTGDTHVEFINAAGKTIVKCPLPLPGTTYVGVEELQKYGLPVVY